MGTDAPAAPDPNPGATPDASRGAVADSTVGPGPDIASAAGAAEEQVGAGAAGAVAGSAVRRSGFASAAALIAGLTALSRVVGFGRTLVLGWVAASALAGAYVTANTIPNIIFEIVAGGALASLVVPLVAAPVAAGDRAAAGRTVSALLGWVLLLLVPLAVLVALFARPIVSVLLPAGTPSGPAALDVGAGMLRVFAPQIPLYGIGIVLGGLLQAHRRFAWPVLAPLLSSVVVIAAYVTYALTQPDADVRDVSRTGQLILSGGTTLGVVVLSLCLIIPVSRLRLPIRPALRFPAAARGGVGGLAAVGVITVVAQQLALAVATRLANDAGRVDIYEFTLAQTIFLVPWSVLAVPVATSVYPSLATAAATGDEPAYRRVLSGANRGVLLLSALGAAALIGTAGPVGRLFATVARSARPDPGTVTAALVAFAPGLVGYGLFALHSRALYARRENRYAAVATVTGWGTVIAASFALAAWVRPGLRVPALTAANSIGMTVLAAVLLVLVARRAGAAALHGTARTLAASLAAGAAGAVAGWAVRLPLPGDPGVAGDLVAAILSGAAVLAVFILVAAVLDRDTLRPVITRLRRATAGDGTAVRDGATVGDGTAARDGTAGTSGATRSEAAPDTIGGPGGADGTGTKTDESATGRDARVIGAPPPPGRDSGDNGERKGREVR